MDGKKFNDFVKKQENEEQCAGLKLPALLIMPLQRIPRLLCLLVKCMIFNLYCNFSF